ncbi:MAG: DUF2201 family putative metallopeptidase [Phototrophicaceae bacterium]|jgi:hypothetical protein
MPIHVASVQQSQDLKRRLRRVMPASRFEMTTLTHLAEIVATPDVPTACVECKRRPRMLINPNFVAQFCKADEHLFLLVMHELWHVLLAHTRLYPISTPAHNIAFDAIINAGLMAKFFTAEFMGFFDGIYKPDVFPECLLRPPVGWPFNPQYPELEIAGATEMVKRLYPRNNHHPFFGDKPLYEEILRLLIESGMDFTQHMPILIGGYNTGGEPLNPDGSPINDPFMKEAMKEISGHWTNFRVDGRGYGGAMGKWDVQVGDHSAAVRRVFGNVLRLALDKPKGTVVRRARTPITDVGGMGVLPNYKDRLTAARKKLGVQSLLYAQNQQFNARVPEHPALANIYLDVSGSMAELISELIGLLIPYVQNGQAHIYQFSTAVRPLQLSDLRKGRLHSTGGTSINCVLQHLVNENLEITKAIILTDGEVGAPTDVLAAGIRERGLLLDVVLPNGCQLHSAVIPITRSMVELPA